MRSLGQAREIVLETDALCVRVTADGDPAARVHVDLQSGGIDHVVVRHYSRHLGADSLQILHGSAGLEHVRYINLRHVHALIDIEQAADVRLVAGLVPGDNPEAGAPGSHVRRIEDPRIGRVEGGQPGPGGSRSRRIIQETPAGLADSVGVRDADREGYVPVHPVRSSLRLRVHGVDGQGRSRSVVYDRAFGERRLRGGCCEGQAIEIYTIVAAVRSRRDSDVIRISGQRNREPGGIPSYVRSGVGDQDGIIDVESIMVDRVDDGIGTCGVIEGLFDGDTAILEPRGGDGLAAKGERSIPALRAGTYSGFQEYRR